MGLSPIRPRAYTRGDCAALDRFMIVGQRLRSRYQLRADLRSEGEFGSYLDDSSSSPEGRDEISRTDVNRSRHE